MGEPVATVRASPTVTASDCAPGRACEDGLCTAGRRPYAEEFVYGIANVMAPMHLITSYAMSTITFIARFKFSATSKRV